MSKTEINGLDSTSKAEADCPETIYDFKLPEAVWFELRTKRFDVTSDKFVPGGEFRDYRDCALYMSVNGEVAFQCAQLDAKRLQKGDVIVISSLFVKTCLREHCIISDILDTYPDGHYFDVYAPNMQLALLVKKELQKRCSGAHDAFRRHKCTWSVAVFGRYQKTGCTRCIIRVSWGHAESEALPLEFDSSKTIKSCPTPKVLTIQKYFDLGLIPFQNIGVPYKSKHSIDETDIVSRGNILKAFDVQLIATLYGECDTIFGCPTEYYKNEADYEALIRYRVFEFIEARKRRKFYPIIVPTFRAEIHVEPGNIPRSEQVVCSAIYYRLWNRLFHELELPKLVEKGFVTYSNF